MDLVRGVLPFTIPAQLVLRALDDLHVLAEAARSLPDVEARLTDRVDELEAQFVGQVERLDERAGQVLAEVDRLDRRAEQILGAAGALDRRAEEILATAGALDRRAEEILGAAGALEGRAGEVLAMGETLEQRAAEVADQGGRLADSLPTLERALALINELAPTAQALALTVEPLHGATERLGRIVDRLPDWPRARPPSAHS